MVSGPAPGSKKPTLSEEKADELYQAILEIARDPWIPLKLRATQLRPILEELVSELAKGADLLISDLAARMDYVFQTLDVPRHLSNDLHFVRNRGNKIAHIRGFVPTESEFFRAIGILCRAVSYFSGQGVPPDLKEFVALDQEGRARDLGSPAGGPPVDFIRATIRRIHPAQDVAQPDGHAKRRALLLCSVPDLEPNITVALWGDFSAIADQAWPYATVHLFRLQQVRDRTGLYSTTADSLVVLDPDYLMDVTAVADSIHRGKCRPLRYLVGKFSRPQPTVAVKLGTIAN